MKPKLFSSRSVPGRSWAATVGILLAAACASLLTASPAFAQDAPVRTINEEVTAFSFGPGGRSVYAVHHTYRSKHYLMERDDIWTEDREGKRRRILNGEKFIIGEGAFSYNVKSFHWSLDGRHLLAELFTTRALDGDSAPHDQTILLMLDSEGKELKLPNQEIQLMNAAGGGWMDDGQTVLYLSEVIKPNLLFSILSAHPGPAPLTPAEQRRADFFRGRTFVDAVFDPARNQVFAIERDRNLSGPPRLQRFDLEKETDTELATLANFNGGLSISPGGDLAAYYIDREVLEIRDLTHPNRAARVRIGLGKYQWAADEHRILLRRSTEKTSSEITWVDLPPLTTYPPRKDKDSDEDDPIPVTEVEFHPILHGLMYRDFQISPDGKFVAVIPPGKRNLLIYSLPPR